MRPPIVPGFLQVGWPWLVALLVLLLDQLSKAWVVAALLPGQIQPFLPGLLRLQFVTNSGAAFSLLRGNAAALGVVNALVSLVAAVLLLRRPPRGRWPRLGLALVLAGALGNGIDRWRLGHVIDFLELVPIHFPIFNVADGAINGAVLCFLIDLWPQPAPRRD
ncbi:MAG: signal peptidase II [Synechococcus sp.]|nr:signal peptidase II [Synechococcus sp.]